MTDVLIYGMGQIGNAVAATLELHDGIRILGFIDDEEKRWGSELRDYPCIGGREALADHPNASVMLAIGQVDARRKVGSWLESERVTQISAIHPTAVLPVDCEVGVGSIVGALAVLYVNCKIGRGVFVGPGAIISHDTIVGDYALVSAGSTVGARVDIEEGGFVGAGATVMSPGWGADSRLRIGRDAVVGAGTVVLRNVEDRSVVFGVPARHLRYRDIT